MQIQKRTEKSNLFLIYFGTITSLIGDEIGSVALSIWVALQTDNPVNFALVYSAAKFSRIVFSLFSGSIVDSFNKKKLLYLSDLAQFVLNIFILFLIAVNLDFNLKVFLFCLISVSQGFCLAIFKPASRAILPELINKENLKKANSVLEMSRSLISMLAVIFAAGLVMLLGCELCILINALSFFISALSEIFIRYDFKKKDEQKKTDSKLKKIFDGYRYVLGEKELLSLALLASCLNFFCTPIFSNILTYQFKTVFTLNWQTGFAFINNFLKDEKSFLTLFSSICFFGIGIGNILGSLASQKVSGKNVKLFTLILQSLSFLILGFYFYFLRENNFLFNVILLGSIVSLSALSAGFSMGLFNVHVTSLYQKKVDPEFSGRFFAFNTVLIQISSPIGMLIGSSIAATGIFYPVFLFAGGFLCLLAFFNMT
ncbi:MFS transporter [Treponema sp. OMZ 799]|uniref:MFS transporter n=1 Tax=Treponema sp. OMZ 799 TaxID=2563668 RepID=UPI0020A37601|nr:MFS transporter [Treponema sp. OMZ 799]UTC78488.1 MFS transporter [Treponema sp. OMZ 799]